MEDVVGAKKYGTCFSYSFLQSDFNRRFTNDNSDDSFFKTIDRLLRARVKAVVLFFLISAFSRLGHAPRAGPLWNKKEKDGGWMRISS